MCTRPGRMRILFRALRMGRRDEHQQINNDNNGGDLITIQRYLNKIGALSSGDNAVPRVILVYTLLQLNCNKWLHSMRPLLIRLQRTDRKTSVH